MCGTNHCDIVMADSLPHEFSLLTFGGESSRTNAYYYYYYKNLVVLGVWKLVRGSVWLLIQ